MMQDSHKGLGGLGILAGGGPAPGINGVIAAATIRARLEGLPVHGLLNGFSGLMAGDAEAIRSLEIEDVSRMHYRGGSMLGIARANPTRREEDLDRVIAGLESKGIDKLITIGGDDTAYSAYRVSLQAKGRIAVAHVPKTIDNDLDLPPEIDTFGYQTARAVGVDIVRNLMTDAKTTRRWYSWSRWAGARAISPWHRKGGGCDAHHRSRGIRRQDGPALDAGRHAGRCDHQAATRWT